MELDWNRVDWSRRTRDIAAELGVRASVVSLARGVHAPATKRTYRCVRPRVVLDTEASEAARRAALEIVPADDASADALYRLRALLGVEAAS